MNSHPVERALGALIQDFQLAPHRYFTEEDVRWRLMGLIEQLLVDEGSHEVRLRDGLTASLHGEYPTPFRCSMAGRQFCVSRAESLARRGHFDIVLLERSAAESCTFEVVRSQYYGLFLETLPTLPMPLLEYVVELKLYRDLAHPNRTESPGQQAEYAAQAVLKVAAALDAQPGYYQKPFARRGTVLLLDNSHLAGQGDVAGAQGRFWQELRRLVDWRSLPETLSLAWVTPDDRQDRRGDRPARIVD